MPFPIRTLSLLLFAALWLAEGAAALGRGYDALNRITSYTNAAGDAIGYAYDANGNLTTLTYPAVGGQAARTVSYAYDDQDRLVSVTDWAGRVTTYAWDANSRLTQLVRPNQTRRTLSYDAAGQVLEIAERQADGRVIHLQRLGYDAAGRVGHRFSVPVPQPYAEPALSATYDLDDRMLTYNGQALSYDGDGNLLGAPLPDGPWGSAGSSSGASGVFTWDARNRLTGVTRSGSGQAVSYGYDSEGYLTSVTTGGQTERLVVDPHGGRRSQVLARVAPGGGRTYAVHGLGLIYEERADGSLRYFHYDQLGSTVALSDSAGVITGRAEYGSFGALARSEGDIRSTPFLYHGRHGVWTDHQTGLHQMRARWYGSQLRRFLNPDPAGFAGGSNFYAFANGNPVSLIDPFGLGAERSDGGFWDIVHTGLDMIGLIPVLGEAADLANAALYAGRGQYGNAALSVSGALPFAGWGAVAIKTYNRADNLFDAGRAAKGADNLVTVRTYTNTAGREGIANSGALRADTWVTLPGDIPHERAISRSKNYWRYNPEEARTSLSSKFPRQICEFLGMGQQPAEAHCSFNSTTLFRLIQAPSGVRQEDPEVENEDQVFSLRARHNCRARVSVSCRVQQSWLSLLRQLSGNP